MNADIQDDFSHGGKIYLNNASVSLTPLDTIKSISDFMTLYSAMGPDSADSKPFVENILQRTRKAISEIIKCSPDEIVFTQSTTDGVNAVSGGLAFPPGSNIIIRGRGHEHHANYYPWLNLSDRVRINSLRIDDNGLFELSQLKDMIDEKTSLVAISHALYNTGAILPVEEIGEMLQRKNIPYFLDAAQTVGCIGDFDVGRIGCDFMAFNGSKWLCGPMGTGIFYCKKDSADLLEPISVGGESVIYDDSRLEHAKMPDKFQAGFRNYAGIAGLESSVTILVQYGMDNIRRRVIRLANQLRDELSKVPGAVLFGPGPEDLRTSIVSFNITGRDPTYIVERLEKQGIVLAVREIMDRKIVRASPHFFNTELQIQKTVDAIKNL